MLGATHTHERKGWAIFASIRSSGTSRPASLKPSPSVHSRTSGRAGRTCSCFRLPDPCNCTCDTSARSFCESSLNDLACTAHAKFCECQALIEPLPAKPLADEIELESLFPDNCNQLDLFSCDWQAPSAGAALPITRSLVRGVANNAVSTEHQRTPMISMRRATGVSVYKNPHH